MSAILKLMKYASLWYDSMRLRREREEKPSIDWWSSLKAKMRKHFVPRTYRQELYVKLNSIPYSNPSWVLSTKFERLHMTCNVKEADEQNMARFLVRL